MSTPTKTGEKIETWNEPGWGQWRVILRVRDRHGSSRVAPHLSPEQATELGVKLIQLAADAQARAKMAKAKKSKAAA